MRTSAWLRKCLSVKYTLHNHDLESHDPNLHYIMHYDLESHHNPKFMIANQTQMSVCYRARQLIPV